MERLGATDVHLIEGGRGVFDIRVDGALVYSKHATGRFPTEAEIDAVVTAPRSERPAGDR
ncbi:MAG TPA: Rdx family protein [Gammaproteobacteria bacterium]|mgnify:CR=1 FL=1|nr:Rdx family protein [Gammaproteobacteria bacterium]